MECDEAPSNGGRVRAVHGPSCQVPVMMVKIIHISFIFFRLLRELMKNKPGAGTLG